MVAQNPLFRGRWTLKRFQATVINDIWPEVLFFTLIALMVSLVSKLTETKLGVNSQLLTVLGTVLGLVISFRTSSAYERYQDGRKMWTNIGVASRNLAQMLWIHSPTDRSDKPACKGQTILEATIEKKTMINLIQAFSVSVKHFLRDEPGVYYEDLYPLICFLPRYANDHIPHEKLPLWHTHDGFEEHPKHRSETPPVTVVAEDKFDGKSVQSQWFKPNRGRRSRRNSFDPERALPQVESEQPLKPARNPPESTIADYIPLFKLFKWIGRVVMRRARSKSEERDTRRRLRKHGHGIDLVESNVPLEIILVLSNYTAHLMRLGLFQPAIATGVTNSLTTLQDTLANLERICNTPLPFAYQAHLRMSLWLYLLFLPFQVYTNFGWLTIPGTAFASFLLLGFLEIGQEIENPFNYDLNDLDLDHFCLSLQRELHEITAHSSPNPTEILFTNLNQPFAPADRRGADELVRLGSEYRHPDNQSEAGMSSIRRTLVGSWREVDLVTRHIT
ncbi:UPF0187-domain-containing protein [Macrolepiota fuliginosa MF-IS2]|uniref:UPF0187-domain-containing protein n=1 Tax=Macrolepiota fuliginosa MF-IS2 TaxID=1400762 RepID=A0A9P5XC10_9AGAR|nr:UPF0187-domain-containing protein [Macrolepiota fuliginosa MF-IS2]